MKIAPTFSKNETWAVGSNLSTEAFPAPKFWMFGHTKCAPKAFLWVFGSLLRRFRDQRARKGPGCCGAGPRRLLSTCSTAKLLSYSIYDDIMYIYIYVRYKL